MLRVKGLGYGTFRTQAYLVIDYEEILEMPITNYVGSRGVHRRLMLKDGETQHQMDNDMKALFMQGLMGIAIGRLSQYCPLFRRLLKYGEYTGNPKGDHNSDSLP